VAEEQEKTQDESTEQVEQAPDAASTPDIPAAEPEEAEPSPAEPAAEAEPPSEDAPTQAEPAAEVEAEAAPAAEPATQVRPKRKRVPRSERRQRPKRRGEPTGERKPIVRLPKPEGERGRRQERRGVVVSSAMDRTIIVKVDTIKAHPRYKKVIRRSTKFHAHDERNEAKVGDVVRIIETRPLSKTKRWRLAEVVEVAR
jgi:ribosomal protein uS17